VFLGLGGPIGPAIMVSVMIVAIASVHWGHGLFAATNGVEIPLLYGAAAAALALTGPGAYSIDAFVGWLGWSTAVTSLTALAVAALGALGNLVMRDLAPVSSKIAA
jgi:putative oxidoreductase